MNQQFSLGLTLWPPRPTRAAQMLCSWGEYDQGALRDAMAHIAELGFDTVRIELRWAEVQPGPARIDMAALRGVERALDLANEQGLRTVVATMAGSLGGALHLPTWASGFRLASDTQTARSLGPAPAEDPARYAPLLDGERYRREPVRDLYGDPEMRVATRYLLHELIGNFADHPAIAGWQLAADLERARRPATARAAAAWWADLCDQARNQGARRILGVVSAFGLARSDTLRPEQIHAAGAEVAVSAAPFPPPQIARPWEAAAPGFLYALVTALLRANGQTAAQVSLGEIGLATAIAGAEGWQASEAFGQQATAFLASEEQQALLVEQALAAAQRAGAAGVWLAGYADQSQDFWQVPPVDRAWPARSWGIVAADGREKPVATAVRTFAARLRAGSLPAQIGPPTLPIDPERYWRDPQTSLLALWAEWNDTQ